MKTITKRIEDFIYKFTVNKFSRKIKDNHIESVVGLENLPDSGPYIIVSNHSSFADHFLLSAIYHFSFNEKLMYLTKKESFETWHSRVWHNATGCIPVDRDKIDMNSIKNIINYIKKGRIIVIYPEGTRGSGEKLLPFKSGAFKIAAMMKVPIIPIGLIDSNKIMVKGSKKFAPYKAKVLIGKPIEIQEIKEIGPDAVLEKCQRIINNMVYSKINSDDFLTSRKITSQILADKAEEKIESMLYEGINLSHKEELGKAMSISQYAIINDENNVQAHIQYTRAFGLNLLISSKLKFLLNSKRIPELVTDIARIDKNHPFAKYILGSYYLNLPSFFKRNKEHAFGLLRDAYYSAPNYEIEQDKFAMSFAKALVKTKRTSLAKEILEAIAVYNGSSNERTQRRSKQAADLLKTISKAA